MIAGILKKVFGSRNERLVKQYAQTAKAITALEPQMQALSDQALAAKTPEFKQRIANGESLDSLLPEAFAVVREARARTPFELEVVDIAGDARLEAEYRTLLPVIEIDGVRAFTYFVTVEALLDRMQEDGSPPR